MQAVLLVSGVITARGLGVEDRGQFALVVLWPVVLSMAGAFGVPDALTYYVARAPQAWWSIARRIWPLLTAQAATSTAAHALIAWVAFEGEPEEVERAAVASLAAIPLMLVQRYALAVLQGSGSFRAFNVGRVLQPGLYSTVLAVTFVTVGMDLISATVAWLASLLVAAGVTVGATLRLPSSDQGITLPRTRVLLAFGGKSLLGSSSPAETFRLDQALVGLLLSPEALGLYVVALAFTNLPRFLAQSVGLVAFPSMAGAASDRRWHWLWRFVGLATALAVSVALLLAVAMPWVVPCFFGNEFAPAADVARVLLLAAVLRAISRALGDCLRGLGMPGFSSFAEFLSLIVLVVALLVLVPTFGVNGAAWAMVAGGIASLLAFARFPRARVRAGSAGDIWASEPPAGSPGVGDTD